VKRIKEQLFINNIREIGLKLDPKYPDSAILSFDNVSTYSRFWNIPDQARKYPFFTNTILTNIDPWKYVYIWKHMGSWDVLKHRERVNDDIQALIYKGAGISRGNSDILQFTMENISEITTIIFNQLVFGWCVGDDIYIIPNHGKQIIQTSHHDVVHVEFLEKSRLNKFIKNMAKNRFPLPTEVPDGTFYKPDWMV
jgi:hypothetical protein